MHSFIKINYSEKLLRINLNFGNNKILELRNVSNVKINQLISKLNFDKICWKVIGNKENSSFIYLIKDYIVA